MNTEKQTNKETLSIVNEINLDKKPSQLGYLPLCDEYLTIIEQVIKTFNINYNKESFWLHLNSKLFSNLKPYLLDFINPYSVIEFLQDSLNSGLNPLSKEILGFYDYNNNCVKSYILIDGYYKIVNSHPEYNGMKYICSEKCVDMDIYVRSNVLKNGKISSEVITRKISIPTFVECVIYRKDREHPISGVASIEDIGSSSAWQTHPMHMLRMRAFTRAVRACFNVACLSSDDAEEIINEQNMTIAASGLPKATINNIVNSFSKRISNITNASEIDALKAELLDLKDKLPTNTFETLKRELFLRENDFIHDMDEIMYKEEQYDQIYDTNMAKGNKKSNVINTNFGDSLDNIPLANYNSISDEDCIDLNI